MTIIQLPDDWEAQFWSSTADNDIQWCADQVKSWPAPSADPATIERVARAMFVAHYSEHDRLWLSVRDEYCRLAAVAVRALQGEA